MPYRHYAPVLGLGFWAGVEVPPPVFASAAGFTAALLCVGIGDVHVFHTLQSQTAAYPGGCAGRFAPPSSCVTVATA